MPSPAGYQRGMSRQLRSRDNSPHGRSPRNAERETVSVFCRIRHVSGLRREDLVETSSQDSDSDDTVNGEQDVVACKVLDQRTVGLTTIDRRKDVEINSQYAFTQAFGPKTGQKAVFDTTARPLVDRLIEGGNGLLFAYGVTGSGKTYTMMGSKQQPGVLPRCLNMLFSSISDYQTNPCEIRAAEHNTFEVRSPVDAMSERQEREVNTVTKYSVHQESRVKSEDLDFDFVPCTSDKVNVHVRYAVFVQFVEIYNDRVYDLLDDNATLAYYDTDNSETDVRNLDEELTRYKLNGAQTSKKVRDDSNNQTYVDGAKEVEVKNIEAAFEQYIRGKERRRLAQTELNFSSSRSHSIFQIRLVRAPYDSNSDMIFQDPRLLEVSRLALVDLAGSERVARTGAQGSVLSEASNINTSLMALRRCVEALRKRQRGQNEFVPFRQKKIVYLFKPFFEGEGLINILICVNPARREANETEQVLCFAESVKKVEVEKEEISSFDMEAIERRKRELEDRDQKRKDQQAQRQRDLQKNIRGRPVPAWKKRETAPKEAEVETGSETGYTSQYTLESCDIQIPDSLGPPPPVVESVEIRDEKTFPKVMKWLLARKERMQEVGSLVTRTMPVHVKNLKSLISQYDNHQTHFRELSERYDDKLKENESLKKTNKRQEAKNMLNQRQIGKLEREKQETGIAVQEKDARIRELTRQARSQRNELDKQLGLAERRHKMESDKAIRDAIADKDARLKSKDAKLAQLKHVLDKTKFDGDKCQNRPNTRSQSNNNTRGAANRRRSPSPTKRAERTERAREPYTARKNTADNGRPLSGAEKEPLQAAYQGQNGIKRYNTAGDLDIKTNPTFEEFSVKYSLSDCEGDTLDQHLRDIHTIPDHYENDPRYSMASLHINSSDFTKYVDENNNDAVVPSKRNPARYSSDINDVRARRRLNFPVSGGEHYRIQRSPKRAQRAQVMLGSPQRHSQETPVSVSELVNTFDKPRQQKSPMASNTSPAFRRITESSGPKSSPLLIQHDSPNTSVFTTSSRSTKRQAPTPPGHDGIQRATSLRETSKKMGYTARPGRVPMRNALLSGAHPVTHGAPLRRRSRSADPTSPYLSHKPMECMPTNTILQPNCKVSKHVHMPTEKDLHGHKKYLLTAQKVDSDGEVQTAFLKGDIVRTRRMQNGDQGVAVQFTDMEILKTKDPQNLSKENKYQTKPSPNYRNKRASDTPLEELDSNAPSQWTDIATRCQTAVEFEKGKGSGPTVIKHIK